MLKKKNKIGYQESLELRNNPKSVVSEQIRTLRSNILFTSSDNKLTKIMVTSSEQGEGKSTISSNLALAFSQAGYRTLLVDSDLRRPTQHKLFEVINAKGLSNVIAGQADFDQVVKKDIEPYLDVITSGPIPPNPSELLGSLAMETLVERMDQSYDLVIFDAPPVLAVTDAQVIGNLVDGSLLVVNAKTTHRDKVVDSKNQLQKSSAQVLGVVLNELDKKEDGDYYYYYGES
ncbi:polysaccharide biosynthesis tyrosine autokinase [Macrococcoides goetzii]|nr:CpsD/CapB family tyrosine-protein kinase [Macrococcus goetzii]TDM46088.1 polysaccharide biosynthesis tyrosine autokinase [Macrococcus goetzii]